MRALIRVFLIVIQNSHFFGKVDMSQYETPHNNSEFKIRNSRVQYPKEMLFFSNEDSTLSD